jgi:glycosyltransferase involved in cell wall biosynthesis
MAVRVLVLTKSLGRGGAERLIVTSLATRNRADFDYEVAYVMSSENALVGEIDKDIPVHDLGSRGNTDLSWLPRLRKLLQEGRFAVVHSHLPYAASFGRLVALTLDRRVRPRLVFTQHWDWTQIPAPVRLLSRLTIGLDDSVFAVSESTLESMPAAVRRRAEVLVHGVDLEAVRSARGSASGVREELGVGPGRWLVVTVANLRAEKGYDVLLEATRHLVERGVDLEVVAVGGGPLDHALRQLHQQLGLEDRFRFLGSREDAWRLMAAGDLFVLASRAEGLPVALMEALALGIPVVATAVGGIPDVVEDGANGRLVPPDQPQQLAEAVAGLLGDADTRRRLGREGLATSSRFDARLATAAIETRYQELIRR